MKILDNPTATKEQIKAFLKIKKANNLALNLIDDFYSIAIKEGVNPTIVIVQAMIETGWFKFGGVLNASYKNPCGLKNTAGGGCLDPNAHARFPTWNDGITAHIEHLALYAGAKGYPKKNPKDPRHFPYLLGKCPAVEDLTGNWAMDKCYADKILKLSKELENIKIEGDIKMNIIENNFKFGSLSNLGAVKYITVHHRAGNGDVKSIHDWHLKQGWAGIGYHFYIRKDGSIYRGRPENKLGSHTGGANTGNIGVSFEGDFSKSNEKMSSAQLKSGRELLTYLKKKYPSAVLKKHNDFGGSTCPGQYFPYKDVINTAGASTSTPNPPISSKKLWEVSIQGEEVKTLQRVIGVKADGFFGDDTLGKCPLLKQSGLFSSSVMEMQKRLNKLGYKFKTDGYFGPTTLKYIKEFQKARKLESDGIVGKNTWKALYKK